MTGTGVEVERRLVGCGVVGRMGGRGVRRCGGDGGKAVRGHAERVHGEGLGAGGCALVLWRGCDVRIGGVAHVFVIVVVVVEVAGVVC